MKYILIILLTLSLSKIQAQDCTPDKRWKPIVTYMIGLPAHMSLQAGVIGQKSPVSLLVGVRPRVINDYHANTSEVKVQPTIEMNYRVFHSRYVGIHAYISNTGIGGVLNWGDDSGFGMRIRAGYKEGAFGIFKII